MYVGQLKEQEIKRQFQDAAKIQQKQFKVYRSHQLAKTSKSDQKEVVKRLKEEQLRRMAMLSQQYDASIAEMIERQNVRRLAHYCFQCGFPQFMLSGAVVSALDLRLEIAGSIPAAALLIATLHELFTRMCLCHQAV